MKKVLLICLEWKGGMKHYFESIFDSLLQSKVIEPIGLIMLDPKVNNSIEEKNILKRYKNKVKVIYRSVGNLSRKIETLFTHNVDRQIIYYVKSLKADTVHVLWDNGFVNNITEIKRYATLMYTVHDFIKHERAFKGIVPLVYDYIYILRQKKKIKKSNVVVTNSKYQEKLIGTFYKKKMIKTFNMPTSITTGILEGNEVPEEIRGIDDYILFFGRIEKYKGIEYLVEAFKEYQEINSNYKLVIAGSGEIYFPTKSDNNIIFINRFIQDNELAILFKKSKIVVLPYISATQSGPPSIAHHYNIPIIASNLPGIQDFVKNYETGILVEPRSTESLGRAMIELLYNNELYTMVKSNQMNFYNNYYVKSTLLNSLETLYT